MTAARSAPGKFITLEGGEGAGKSTQARKQAAELGRHNINARVTREPGGTSYGEKIRNLVLTEHPASAVTELLLFAAARAEHLAALIRPARQTGQWVICDRFIDSTRVYQGRLGGVDPALILAIETSTVAPDMPDLTLVLDLPAQIAVQRVSARGEGNRFDAAKLEQYETLRQGFLDIARAEPGRCIVIDGSQAPETVARAIWSAVNDRFIGAPT